VCVRGLHEARFRRDHTTRQEGQEFQFIQSAEATGVLADVVLLKSVDLEDLFIKNHLEGLSVSTSKRGIICSVPTEDTTSTDDTYQRQTPPKLP
jgi:hypothetical protein